jgi:hypothetical protein
LLVSKLFENSRDNRGTSKENNNNKNARTYIRANYIPIYNDEYYLVYNN